MQGLTDYLASWSKFRRACEEKAKDRCHINSKGWKKLRDFHMEMWLDGHESPFGFMFNLKHRHTSVYRSISCAPKYYHKTRLQREAMFGVSMARKAVVFPSWRGFLKDETKEV